MLLSSLSSVYLKQYVLQRRLVLCHVFFKSARKNDKDITKQRQDQNVIVYIHVKQHHYYLIGALSEGAAIVTDRVYIRADNINPVCILEQFFMRKLKTEPGNVHRHAWEKQLRGR